MNILKEILPILDELKPKVENCAKNISNPEARSIIEGLKTMNKASNNNDNLVILKVTEINQDIILINKEMSLNIVNDENLLFIPKF